MGLPLSVCRGEALPGSRWGPRDWLVAQAFSYLQTHTCSSCGTPNQYAFSKELSRTWEVTTLRCHPCAAVAKKAASYSEDKAPHTLRFGAFSKYAD